MGYSNQFDEWKNDELVKISSSISRKSVCVYMCSAIGTSIHPSCLHACIYVVHLFVCFGIVE